MEDNNIGWAWWAHKKIKSISAPFSSPLTEEYDVLLNYWNNGGTKPSQAFAVDALTLQAEKLKCSNCTVQSGVVDALIRQPYSYETIPYTNHELPGRIYVTDYDIGRAGAAYQDAMNENTGGNSYNNGWQYRNDGVDIEECSDNVTNGYNVGWTETGEWLLYTVNVSQSGTYNLKLRITANEPGGKILMVLDNGNLTDFIDVPVTGGWQNWNTVNVNDIFIPAGEHKLTAKFFLGGFNINYLEFDLVTAVADENIESNYNLAQNYPNPFNPSTTINYEVAEIFGMDTKQNNVSLKIFDIAGSEIRTLVDEEQSPGKYSVLFNAEHLPTGVYFYELTVGKFQETKKMILLR